MFHSKSGNTKKTDERGEQLVLPTGADQAGEDPAGDHQAGEDPAEEDQAGENPAGEDPAGSSADTRDDSEGTFFLI